MINFFNEEVQQEVREFFRDIIREELAAFAEQQQAAQQPDHEGEFLTRYQLRDRWKVSLPTLDNYVRKGFVTPVRLGGRRLVFPLIEILKAEAEGVGR